MTDQSVTTGLAAHLDVTLGDFHLDVDLRVEPGRVVAILGPNGAGKSTVLRALAGLDALDAGHIRLDGTVLGDPATGIHRVPPSTGPSPSFSRTTSCSLI